MSNIKKFSDTDPFGEEDWNEQDSPYRVYKNNRMDHCPVCDSDDMHYYKLDESNDENGVIYYEYVCETCGFKGREYYTLTFKEHRDAFDNPIIKGKKVNDKSYE